MKIAKAVLALGIQGALVEAKEEGASIIPKHPIDCRNIDLDGFKYDLSALNKEWTVDGKIPLRFNPCGPITYANEFCPRGTSYMCAMDPGAPQTGRANIGVPRELFRNPQNELIMLLSGGSYDLNGFPFVSLVRFVCDLRATGEVGPVEPIVDNSKYFLVWKTRAACPAVSMGMIGGAAIWTLLSWIFVGLVIYLVGGFLFNVFTTNRRGREAIPHHEFWTDLGSFFAELCSNLKNRLRGGPSGGYQQI